MSNNDEYYKEQKAFCDAISFWLDEAMKNEKRKHEENVLKENLILACKEYWEARKKLYADQVSGTTKAKLKMYKAMSEMFGKYEDGYPEDYYTKE